MGLPPFCSCHWSHLPPGGTFLRLSFLHKPCSPYLIFLSSVRLLHTDKRAHYPALSLPGRLLAVYVCSYRFGLAPPQFHQSRISPSAGPGIQLILLLMGIPRKVYPKLTKLNLLITAPPGVIFPFPPSPFKRLFIFSQLSLPEDSM